MKMRKWILAAALGLCVFGVSACGKKTEVKVETEAKAETEVKAEEAATESETETEDAVVGMPNPFVEYDTVEEAMKHISFTVTVPETIEGYTEKNISVMNGEMIQVVYSKDDQEICIRKQAGEGDISGDYNTYDEEQEMEVDGAAVTLRGNDGTIRNAIWSVGGYAFSLYTDKGFTKEAAADLIAQIK